MFWSSESGLVTDKLAKVNSPANLDEGFNKLLNMNFQDKSKDKSYSQYKVTL
jgi:hypothetical protein